MQKNIIFIKKILYSSYSLNYIGSDFFIKYLRIQQINCIVSYYPKKCSYYKLFGNMSEIYKNIKYKDIDLRLIYISVYYPADFQIYLKQF